MIEFYQTNLKFQLVPVENDPPVYHVDPYPQSFRRQGHVARTRRNIRRRNNNRIQRHQYLAFGDAFFRTIQNENFNSRPRGSTPPSSQ